MIRLRSVTYSYPNQSAPALSDVDLEIDQGQFVLVVGPSGSGKSTVLRIMNGLVPHFSGGKISGSVIVNGLDVLRAGPQALSRHIGFVSQNPEAQALLDSVEPEIAFGLENAAVARQEMLQRVGEALDILNLSPLRSRSISTLSGGERQRVAIASALALRPGILILDEPTSQLDPESAAGVLESLQSLNRDLGLTIVLAEHRLDRVLAFADRIACFEGGRLVNYDAVRKIAAAIPHPPPLLEIARRLNWDPIPLTVVEAQQHAQRAVQGAGHLPSALHLQKETEPALRVDNLHFAYKPREPVLRGINLTLDRGEILAIMGVNGSGKSTLLKCLVGLLRPTRGEISLNGRSILGRETVDLAKQVAYLPQYPDDLLFAETVSEELEITLRNHGIRSPERVVSMLDTLGLAAAADAYPRDLSTGQRQRVALGAITVTQPDILLLDEPTRGLDGRLKLELAQLWMKWREEGSAIILVTHDVELAAQLADRVLIMEAGRISERGTAREVFTALSPFAPQITRVFPGRGWLTVEDALAGLAVPDEAEPRQL